MLYRHPFYDPTVNVLIEDSVWVLLQPYRQSKVSSTEAGGILLGYRRGPHLHVVDATMPAARDRRKRAAFWRLDPVHQLAATDGWARTQETMDYLGEWHTHPEARPSPSSVDLEEWRKVCSRTSEMMAFLIVGIDLCWLGIGNGPDIRQAQALNVAASVTDPTI
jgi:integrative and conjugative element protein (TIGR02256 family)